MVAKLVSVNLTEMMYKTDLISDYPNNYKKLFVTSRAAILRVCLVRCIYSLLDFFPFSYESVSISASGHDVNTQR